MRDCRIGHELICQCTKNWKSRNSPANKARSTRCAVRSLQSAFYYDRFPKLSTWFAQTLGNGLSHKTWSYFLFAQHLEAYLLLGLRWTCLQYVFFSIMLEAEESISEIDSHHLLQEASDMWSCNETGSWQFEVTGTLWYGIVWLYNFAE